VTPRSVLRYETWTLQPDREPDAEPVLYAMQCAVDRETSPTCEDFTEPQNWVLRHCGQNPSHHTYREIITRPWRAFGRPDPPCSPRRRTALTYPTPVPAGRGRSRLSRPRQPWQGRALTCVPCS
jgi:hypothetical protein